MKEGFISYILYRLLYIGLGGSRITMRDPLEGFYKRPYGSLQNPPIQCYLFFFLLQNEYSRTFYNLLFSIFFYFFSVFWILPKFRYIYFMKSKERAGEWISLLCNFSSIPLVFWLRWLRHLLFVGVAETNRSACRVLFSTAAEALDRLLVEKI